MLLTLPFDTSFGQPKYDHSNHRTKYVRQSPVRTQEKKKTGCSYGKMGNSGSTSQRVKEENMCYS